MSERCCAKQVAEAIGMWSSHKGTSSAFCIELEDSEKLKCLDLILSTLVVFRDAFSTEMAHSCFQCIEYSTSKIKFLDYLKPRAVLLADKNGYFDFMLICTYFSQIINHRACYRNCFHLARVACKVLTKILEDKFSSIFETDSNWQKLISYCKSIHAAVFPSRENRPPGYEMDYRNLKLSIDSDGIAAFAKEAEVGEELDENKVTDLKVLKQRTGRDPNLLSEVLGLMPKSSDSTIPLYDEIDCEKPTYWKYHSLDSIIICKRITRDETHLTDVCRLLMKMKYMESMQFARWHPTLRNDYSKSFSKYINELEDDDGYIELLDKGDVNQEKQMEKREVLSFIEKDLLRSNQMRKFFVDILCQKENERLGATSGKGKVRPEDITDDQIREFYLKEFIKEDTKCQRCEGKMRAFGENWSEIFQNEYSNANIVTSLVSMSVDQNLYKKLQSWKLV